MTEKILEIKKLTKKYKKSETGILNLNFNVEKGSFHAFIGENGAGKTTTIKSIIGAYTNYEGEIIIDNFPNTNPLSKLKIGYVPENAIFPKELTTYEYLFYLARLSNIEKNIAKTKINFFLEKMFILDLKNKKPFNFSSGQKKKILLIQALLHEPKLIILDEPAANLDPSARLELFEILKNLNEDGKTIFISSHILKEIDQYTTHLTLIHKGQIIYTGKKYLDLETIYKKNIFNHKK